MSEWTRCGIRPFPFVVTKFSRSAAWGTGHYSRAAQRPVGVHFPLVVRAFLVLLELSKDTGLPYCKFAHKSVFFRSLEVIWGSF